MFKIKVGNYLATVSASIFISSTEEIIFVNNFFSFGCFEPILASFGRNHLNCNFLKHWRCCCYTMFCSAPAYNISIFSNKILPIFLEKKYFDYKNIHLDNFEEFTRSMNQFTIFLDYGTFTLTHWLRTHSNSYPNPK